MIAQVINLWNIHELWYFVSFNIQNIRKKSDSNSVSCSKFVFLHAATWERLRQSVIKVYVNWRIWCIGRQYLPLFTLSSQIPLKFIVNARVTSCLFPFSFNQSIPSYIDPSRIDMICKIINLGFIHKLRNLISINVFD